MSTEAPAFEGSRGREFTSLDWLANHHRAKEADRRLMVADLPLRRGDTVLDVGCGPGFWAAMIAERVAPGGRVIGLDNSPELIGHARALAAASTTADRLDFRVGDFYDLDLPDASVDCVFIGSCFPYISEPARFIAEQKRVTKPGGVIVAKDFDAIYRIFHPVNTLLSLRIFSATEASVCRRAGTDFFDNAPGRKLSGYFRRFGLDDVQTRSHAIQMVYPLSTPQKHYLARDSEWYAQNAGDGVSDDDRAAWLAHFDTKSPQYVLDSPDFYFCTVEIMTTGRVR